MSFTNGIARTATDKDLAQRWLGGKPGEYFRCAMCGYRFSVGDTWRFVFTNDIPGASGNPLVCNNCDGPDVRERWKGLCDEWRADKFWFFRRG